MNKYSHTNFATMCSLFIIQQGLDKIPLINLEQTLYTGGSFVIGSIIGCRIPDIDSEKSSIGNKFKFISKTFGFLSKINKGFGHRGITHTLLFPVLFLLLFFKIGTYVPNELISTILKSMFLGISFGWVSHIVLDMTNRSGAPILFPITMKPIHFLSIKYNGKLESFLSGLFLFISLILILNIIGIFSNQEIKIILDTIQEKIVNYWNILMEKSKNL